MKKVSIIGPHINMTNQPLKIACYARVSSDSEEQMSSLSSMISFFESYTRDIPNSVLVGIFTDEGITGTSMKKRDGFNKLINLCRQGKINRIITKSISRFARNITESLTVLRELKALGVSVLFLTENIDTAKSNSEMMLAVYSMTAEMESKAIAYNQRWGFRTRAKNGYYNQSHLPYGYKRVDKEVVIYEKQAIAISKAFELYVNEDYSTLQVSDYLNQHQLGDRKWSQRKVSDLLKNERYCGDMLLQKKYTPDVFPYRLVKNKGDIAQYYVYDVFPAIVDRELFQKALDKIKKRALKYNINQTGENQIYAFTSKIVCEDCGTRFKRKVVRKKEYWGCQAHIKKADDCEVKMISKEELEDSFIHILYKLNENKFILESYQNQMMDYALDESTQEEKKKLKNEIAYINKDIQRIQNYYHKHLLDDQQFQQKYNELVMNRTLLELEKTKINERIYKRFEVLETKVILDCLSNMEAPYVFDKDVFHMIVDHVVVGRTHMTFVLRNGLNLKVERSS